MNIKVSAPSWTFDPTWFKLTKKKKSLKKKKKKMEFCRESQFLCDHVWPRNPYFVSEAACLNGCQRSCACMCVSTVFYLFRFGRRNNYYAGLDEEVLIRGVWACDNVVAASAARVISGVFESNWKLFSLSDSPDFSDHIHVTIFFNG